jgi:hypothetical protein
MPGGHVTAIVSTWVGVIADWIIRRGARGALWADWVLAFAGLRSTQVQSTWITVITFIGWMQAVTRQGIAHILSTQIFVNTGRRDLVNVLAGTIRWIALIQSTGVPVPTTNRRIQALAVQWTAVIVGT